MQDILNTHYGSRDVLIEKNFIIKIIPAEYVSPDLVWYFKYINEKFSVRHATKKEKEDIINDRNYFGMSFRERCKLNGIYVSTNESWMLNKCFIGKCDSIKI